jgi:DNA-binding transcriptional ArsR family regulator
MRRLYKNNLASTFQALDNSYRRDMLFRMADREWQPMEFAKLYGISRPAISRHLKILRAGGFLYVRKWRGQHFYTLDPSPLKPIFHALHDYQSIWLEQFGPLLKALESKA